MTQINEEVVSNGRDSDRLDRAILEKFALNPKVSSRELAKQLNLPQPTIAARVRTLQTRGVLRIRPVLNVSKAGRNFVFCKLAINTADLETILHKVSKYGEFFTVASIFGGKHNALVYFTYGSMSELHYILNEIILKIDDLSEIETSIISDSILFKPEYIKYPGSPFEPDIEDIAKTLRQDAARCDLDDLDISILSELQYNGQKSLRAIARDYNVNPGTVNYRLRQMERRDIVKFVSVIAYQELSLNCFLIVEIRVEPGSSPSIAKRVSEYPWLTHVHETVGSTDLNAFLSTHDLAEGQRAVSIIRGIPGIKSVSVFTLMRTFKFDPRWGVW